MIGTINFSDGFSQDTAVQITERSLSVAEFRKCMGRAHLRFNQEDYVHKARPTQ